MKSENEGIWDPHSEFVWALESSPGMVNCFLGGKFRLYGTNRQNLSHASPKKEGSDGESFQVRNFQESDSQVVLVTLLATVMGCYLRVHVLKA